MGADTYNVYVANDLTTSVSGQANVTLYEWASADSPASVTSIPFTVGPLTSANIRSMPLTTLYGGHSASDVFAVLRSAGSLCSF